MCGIFGFVPGTSSFEPGFIVRAATALFRLSETRGKEASGLAVEVGGSLQVLKRPWRASQLVKSAEYLRVLESWDRELRETPGIPRALIGHSRLVTNGSRETHFNNQPVIRQSAVGVHNGIVVNVDSLWQVHPELGRRYEVDSEVIFALIEHFTNESQSISAATRKTFEEIRGATSIAAVFSDLELLLLATNNGSLYYSAGSGPFSLAFASEEQILSRFLSRFAPDAANGIKQLAPGTGLSFGEGSVSTFSLSTGDADVPPIKRAARSKPIVDIGAPKEPAAAIVPQFATGRKVPARFEKHVADRFDATRRLRRCSRCILPETMPFISFDREGVCSYCLNHQPMRCLGEDALKVLVDSARATSTVGRSNCDCVVAISGGRDSCYGLHYLKTELGLRPVTYTYDWGMITDLARRNISRLCGALGVEHILISADIVKKRAKIRKNVSAWLRRPELGTIPLFMAGDKHFYYFAHQLRKQFHTNLMFLSENQLEKTDFKSGYAGVPPAFKTTRSGVLPWHYKLSLAKYYLTQFAKNPAYLNSSIFDTALAYGSYYVLPHDFIFLFHYLRWDEHQIVSTLRNGYDWELAHDTASSWRIGDGTTPFYNYIYLNAAGFTEYDAFRSNQIREGQITRDEALRGVYVENQPRWDSIRWYLDTIELDFEATVDTINAMPNRFPEESAPLKQTAAGRPCAG